MPAIIFSSFHVRTPGIRVLGALALAVAVLASGCSSAAPRRAAQPAPAAAPISGAPVAVAQQQQATRLLASATSALAAGDAARALQLYSQIDPAALADERRLGYFLDRADAAVQEGDLLLARDLLTNPELQAGQSRVSAEAHRRWLGLRGQLFGLLGDAGTSVSAYVELTDALTDPEEKREIERAIWQVLERTPTAALSKLATEPANARLHGWYQLALASREQTGTSLARSPSPSSPSSSIEPAIPGPPPAAAGSADGGPLPPLRQIALLLPRSGAYSAPANAIRDGFMAAGFAARSSGTPTPDIRLYDAAAGDVLDLYRRAVAEGAQLVIGPLDQQALTRLAAEPSLSVPVLGLNELEGKSPSTAANFHTLSLAVTDEAEAAARRAWQDGRRAALVLVPDAPWGRRALDAFRDTFTQLGGEVRAGTLYDMALKDFVPVLRPLFAPSAATAPPPSPGAEPPRRRTDIDMVFLVAYPAQGRQIKPSLDFLYAGDLPIYATSAIYAGVAEISRDGDLNDIRFSTMPWALAASLQQAPAPETELPPVYRPFFALGVDAYLIHPLLGAATPHPGASIAGHTGTLTVDDAPRVHRLQPWAQFRNGRAYPEGTPP